ncbi:hypothetical protein OG306_33350 [Streptomyces sp. NBC_01241]|uniref:hypothetical protein n=1 Tax=Streptomyces sp. NBC_01241 TaxID=2903794 RepID=UPI00352F062A|nr:hypothetical protein OG306_33350 [Streptomyces sp. NBC_01241]
MTIYQAWFVDAHESICELNVGSMQLGDHVFDFDFDSASTVIEEALESLPAGKALVIKEVRG